MEASNNFAEGTVEGDYLIKDKIGSGSFGDVHKALKVRMLDEKSNTLLAVEYAIKKIKKENSLIKKESVENERKIGLSVKHPNIANMLDYFESDNNYYMIFPYFNMGDLGNYLKTYPKGIEEQEALIYLKCIYQGYKYLHEDKIAHRDIKLENILLNKDKKGVITASIADFGVSFVGKVTTSAVAEFNNGTKYYMSPEMLEGKGSNYQSDIFAIGLVYYRMLFGKEPFTATSKEDLLSKMKKGDFEVDLARISKPSVEFMLGCLQYEFEKRNRMIDFDKCPLFTVQLSDLKKEHPYKKLSGKVILNINKTFDEIENSQ